MAGTAKIDLIENLEAVEDGGAVISLTRKYIVYGLSASDFSILYLAGGNASIPIVNSYPPGYPGLRCTRRTVQAIDAASCYVTVEYAAYGRGEPYNFIFSGGSSLTQITTNNTRAGEEIIVQHTWPSSDLDYANVVERQGGQIKVNVPQRTLRATGVIPVDYPLAITTAWEDHLNSSYWASGNAGTWLCTECGFEPHNLATTPTQWMFTFAFQWNILGWQPTATFIDKRSGLPPPDLIYNVGYKVIEYYPYLEFRVLFPNA